VQGRWKGAGVKTQEVREVRRRLQAETGKESERVVFIGGEESFERQ
jgi:hypothetical protein